MERNKNISLEENQKQKAKIIGKIEKLGIKKEDFIELLENSFRYLRNLLKDDDCIKLEEIRQSLINSLSEMGAKNAHFIELVDEYIEYCRLSDEAKELIDRKGITYDAISSTGKVYEKDNPAAKLLPQYTRAKLQILKELGISTKDAADFLDEEL